jgi:uncharacterized protein (DUF2147 family)
MHSIKSSHVDICVDVLETNKTKWHHSVIWLDACGNKFCIEHAQYLNKNENSLLHVGKVFLAYVEFILITSSILKSENT